MIDDRTAHELAAKLHSAKGRIYRARGNANAHVRDDNLSDADSLISEVIADILCAESTAERFSHKTMPVIPRGDHPPVDPALVEPSLAAITRAEVLIEHINAER